MVVALADDGAGHAMGEGAPDFGDQGGLVDPAEPALGVQVALLHHGHIGDTLGAHGVELAKQAAPPQTADVTHAGTHEGVEVESRRVVVVVAEERGVGVAVAAGRVGEPGRELVQPGHRFEADVVVGVHLPDAVRKLVIELLQVEGLRQPRNHHQGVVVHVARPRLVHQLVGDHVGIVLESRDHFHPVVNELVPEPAHVLVKVAEPPVDCLSGIVLPPGLRACTVGWQSGLVVELCPVFHDWDREGVVHLSRNSPEWHPIPTEFLTEQVLMELHQRIDVVLACLVHQLHHPLQVLLIELALLGLHARPHHAQPQPVDAVLFQLLQVLLSEAGVVVGRGLGDQVHAVEDALAAILVVYFVIFYQQMGFGGAEQWPQHKQHPQDSAFHGRGVLIIIYQQIVPLQLGQLVLIDSVADMIQKSAEEPHVQFQDLSANAPHRLLFQKQQKILQDQLECTLINYLGCRVDVAGRIILTDFRVLFMTAKVEAEEGKIRFDFPIGYIAKCECSSEFVNKALVFYVDIVTKFGFGLKIRSSSSNLTKVSEHVNQYLGEFPAFGEGRAAGLPDEQKCKKWDHYFNASFSIEEAAPYDNEGWKFLPLYPQIIKVPKIFAGKRSQDDRVVILSYVHQSKKPVGLWKSGPGRPDIEENKWVPSAAKKQDHIVVQIKNKMVGSNKSLAEQMLEMDSPAHLRESFMKFFIATCYENQQQQQKQQWLIHANFSRWYEQVEILISEAFLVLDKICEGINITVLSDWDVRGSQVCALVQVLAQPDNRTISGFGKLIEREFLHFGNYNPPLAKKQKQEDKGIALIQFLDCVYQIKKMYPLSFQFNEDMLTYIAVHIYSRKYGNFLYLTRSTSETNQQKYLKYGCIWAKIDKCRLQFTNPFYVDHRECDIYELKTNVGMKNFGIWGGFFLRDILMYGNTIEINKFNQNHRDLLKRHQMLKSATEGLRAKISEQHRRINQKKKKLKQLQQNQLN